MTTNTTKKINGIMLGLLLFTVPSVWGQTAVQLTLEQAVERALRQNPTISEAEHELEEADARLKQARAHYVPHITTSGIAKIGLSGALNALSPIGLANSPFYRNFAEGLNIYHPGFDFGRTTHLVGHEKYRRDVFEANLETAKAAVRLETTRAYYRALQAKRLKEVAYIVVRSREANVRLAEAFYQGKLRSRLDLEMARFSLSQAKLQALQAENSHQETIAMLGLAMGASQETQYDLIEPDKPLPEAGSLADWVQQSLTHRPELIALRADIEAATEALLFAESQRKPMLSFAFSGGYARFTDVLARQLLALGAGLYFPLYTGGDLEGRIEEARARLKTLESQLQVLEQKFELETRTAYLRLQNALQSIETLNERASYAREATGLARARYQERLGSIVELTQAESNLAEAEASKVIGVYSARTTEAELQFAVGRR